MSSDHLGEKEPVVTVNAKDLAALLDWAEYTEKALVDEALLPPSEATCGKAESVHTRLRAALSGSRDGSDV